VTFIVSGFTLSSAPYHHGENPCTGLGIVFRGLGSRGGEDAYLVVGVCFAPYVTGETGCGTVGSTSRVDARGGGSVVLRGLGADCGCDAHVVCWDSLAPDPALETGVGSVATGGGGESDEEGGREGEEG
jgi:hypothetical protein